MAETDARGEMQIRVRIDPEDVNRELAAAILGSGVGDRVRKAVDKALNEKPGTYGDIFEQAIQASLKDHIKAILESEPFATEIKEKVRERLTNATVDAFVKKVTELGRY